MKITGEVGNLKHLGDVAEVTLVNMRSDSTSRSGLFGVALCAVKFVVNLHVAKSYNIGRRVTVNITPK